MWEQLQRQVHTQVLAGTVAAAMGAQVEVPDEFEVRRSFDAMLLAKPARQDVDRDRMVLLRALGLRDPAGGRRS